MGGESELVTAVLALRFVVMPLSLTVTGLLLHTHAHLQRDSSGQVVEMSDVIDKLPDDLRRNLLLSSLGSIISNVNVFEQACRESADCKAGVADILWHLSCLSFEAGVRLNAITLRPL